MSTISASVSGLNASALSVAVTANNVANANTDGYRAKRLDLETQADGGVRPAALRESQEALPPKGSNVDLAGEAVALDQDKTSYGANLRFLKVQNDMLGAVMDMKA